MVDEVKDQGGLPKTSETTEAKPTSFNLTFNNESNTTRPKYNTATVSRRTQRVNETPEEAGRQEAVPPKEEKPKEEEPKRE